MKRYADLVADALHIPGAINVPRGVLEQSCEWDFAKRYRCWQQAVLGRSL